METSRLHRGRLIDHIQIVVHDLARSRRFYEAVLGALGRSIEGGGDSWFYSDEFFVSSVDSPAAQGRLTGRMHLAFAAADRESVDRFHEAGLAVGAESLGAPGERRNYHPGYYAAFLKDPDGNNIEAVFHGPSKRSAESVEITY